MAAAILYGCGYLILLWKGAQTMRTAIVSNLLNLFMTEAVMQRKSMDWFLYDNGRRHERVKITQVFTI